MGAVAAAQAAPSGAAPSPLSARPQRSAYLRLASVRQRGKAVYRAHDRLSGRTSELSPFAARLLLQCDGGQTVADLLVLARRLEPDVPDSALFPKVMGVLSNAEGLGLIRPLAPPAGGLEPPVVAGWLQRTLRNPLFAQFSLFSPDPLIARLAPLAQLLFNPLAAALWTIVVGAGLWLCVLNWGDLVAYGGAHALDPGNLVWLVLLFPAIKIVHELGHALACKRWGGEVRDFGVMLRLMMPIPYVDCSDSAFFARRRQRIVVAAAGMMVEFVIAAAALVVWLVASNELVRLLAFNTMVLTSITTIAFNANPLLRFDAYYILGDLIGVDNLASRSQRIIQLLSRRLLLGDRNATLPTARWTETALFVGYGIASFAYKCIIVFVVVVAVFPSFFVFGVVLAAWGAVSMIILPVAKRVRAIWGEAAAGRGPSLGAVGRRIGLPLAALALLLAMPVPYAFIADGLVRVPPDSAVRAGASGTVARLPVGQAAAVDPGETLVVLTNSILDAELAAGLGTLRTHQLRHETLLAKDIAQAAQVEAQMLFVADDVRSMATDKARLAVAAHMAGRFALDDAVSPGTYVSEGQAIGLILPEHGHRVAVVSLSQEDADLVRSRLAALLVRPASGDGSVRTARLQREYPLVAAAGEPAQGRFILELALEDTEPFAFGEAVAVRFDLGAAPLAVQLWHSASIWVQKLLSSRYLSNV